MSAVIVYLPPADFWRHKQPAVEEIFGNTPRIICASIAAFWCGSFVNSYVLAKMKLWSSGRWLWTRIVGSTLCGELVDSGLFYTIALDRKSTRLNSSHLVISYAVFCLKKKNKYYVYPM